MPFIREAGTCARVVMRPASRRGPAVPGHAGHKCNRTVARPGL